MTQYKCEICKQPGATFRKYRKVTGLLIFSTTSYTKPIAACDKHKVEGGMSTNLWNFFFGWWGIHALIWNVLAFLENLAGGKDVTKNVEAAYAQHVQLSAQAIQKQKQIKLS